MAKSKGTRLRQIGVDDKIVDELTKFREVLWDASEVKIVEDALRDFLEKWRPEYEAIRRKRSPPRSDDGSTPSGDG